MADPFWAGPDCLEEPGGAGMSHASENVGEERLICGRQIRPCSDHTTMRIADVARRVGVMVSCSLWGMTNWSGVNA